MSKTAVNQNLKLLQSIHHQIDFLKQFNTEQLNELVNRGYFFVFTHGTIIAQQKQQIDFLGIILEGKVNVSGKLEKKSSGYIIGELGYFGVLQKHAYSVIGDTDGIVFALQFEDIMKMNKDIRNVISLYISKESMETLKNPDRIQSQQQQQVQQKKIAHLLHSSVKTLLNEQLETKQKQNLLKFFPFVRYTLKSQIMYKHSQPQLLHVVKGQLIIKSDSQSPQTVSKILAGEFYNCEGFLLNYSTNVNIYCGSEDAIVLRINKRQFQNVIEGSTIQKIYNFLLRKEINDKQYEVITSQKRKEKQRLNLQSNNKDKWTIFAKQTYDIIPLTLPKNLPKENEKPGKTTKDNPKQQKQAFLSTLFRQQLQNNKNIKTTSSANSKLNKMITLKTQKNEQKASSVEQQLKEVQKQLQILHSKIKYYEQNFIKAKLQMIQYKSKNSMHAVFKQINQLGDRRFRNKSTGDTSKVMTLKKAFQQHMRENRIMEVVARCAYKWLWTVRMRKNSNKLRSSLR